MIVNEMEKDQLLVAAAIDDQPEGAKLHDAIDSTRIALNIFKTREKIKARISAHEKNKKNLQ